VSIKNDQDKNCKEEPLTVTSDNDPSEVSVKKITLKRINPQIESITKTDKTDPTP